MLRTGRCRIDLVPWLRRYFDTQADSLAKRFVKEFRERGWRSGLRACFFIAASRAGRKDFHFQLYGYPFRVRGNRRKLGIDGLIYAQRNDYECSLKPYFGMEGAGSTFLDIGANYGYWSRFVLTNSQARGIENVRVVSFEPLPQNYELLVENMIEIPDSSRSVRCEQLAIGNGRGECFLKLGNSDPGSTFIADSGEVKCRMVTLDEYGVQHELPRVDLMKIDVEGFELQVIRGAKNTILRYRPTIICEVIPMLLARAGTCPEELFRELACLGYSCQQISPTDYLFKPMADSIQRTPSRSLTENKYA